MATSNTEISRSATSAVWSVIATADGDTVHDIPHGFGRIPDEIELVPWTAVARDSDWVLITATDEIIRVSKTTAAGSGDPAAQLRVSASLRPGLLR